MNQIAKTEVQQGGDVLTALATKYNMNPSDFQTTVLATCSPKGRNAQNLTQVEFYTLLLAADKYNLNPLMREIYAFPAKGGGIQVIVGVDGWMNLINSHPNFDGMEFEDIRENSKVIAITCRMFRKDRAHPISVTEYMDECKRGTDVWKQWPVRMLRHKAVIQAARYAFGFSNIMEPDEAERAIEAPKRNVAEDLKARRQKFETGEGFDAARIDDALDSTSEPQEDVMDVEPEEEKQEPAKEPQELSDEQQGLLNEIETSFNGCRSVPDLDAEVKKFEDDVNAGGEALFAEANKLYLARKSELKH